MSITKHLFQGYFKCRSYSTRYLKILLERAKPVPLAIAIEGWHVWNAQGGMPWLLELLVPYSRSIQSFSLLNSTILPEWSHLEFTGLRELFLEGDSRPTDARIWALNSLGGSFDSLSQLIIWTSFRDIESMFSGVPILETLDINLYIRMFH